MKCCPHIEVLYKNTTHENLEIKANQDPPVPDFDHLEKLFRLVIKLNNHAKTSNSETNDGDDEQSNDFNLKCYDCDQFTRLYICANCSLISCFSHIEQHSHDNSHFLWIDIGYAAVYCHLCKDFQYNRLLEEFVRELFLKERFFPFGKFYY